MTSLHLLRSTGKRLFSVVTGIPGCSNPFTKALPSLNHEGGAFLFCDFSGPYSPRDMYRLTTPRWRLVALAGGFFRFTEQVVL